jgi:chromosome segregation ATPase
MPSPPPPSPEVAERLEDDRVAYLESRVEAHAEWIEELRAKVREWEDLETWRQAHWETLKTELQTLRAENKTLRATLAAKTQ